MRVHEYDGRRTVRISVEYKPLGYQYAAIELALIDEDSIDGLKADDLRGLIVPSLKDVIVRGVKIVMRIVFELSSFLRECLRGFEGTKEHAGEKGNDDCQSIGFRFHDDEVYVERIENTKMEQKEAVVSGKREEKPIIVV
jgi:hypothetical protein